MRPDIEIPDKANRVLNIVLIGLLLILLRVWYLAVVWKEEGEEQAFRPQRRSVVEYVERGTIRDRFNIPLAMNKIQYNAAVSYAPMMEIPRNIWKKDVNGKQVRIPERVEYVGRLAKELGNELGIDPQGIEDEIYAKASLFPHVPFVIKSNISEEKYYRLRMLEKDWPGLVAQKVSKRVYPLGKVGCDIIGYMGAISQKEFSAVVDEMSILQKYIEEREEGGIPFLPKGFNSPVEVKERLIELQEKAYTINDRIGKMGIEGAFDEELRGYYGKKIYEVDRKGNFLRELPGGRKSVSGRRVLMTISSELQEFAEALLSENEVVRNRVQEQPWIKGGAIVAMIPKTGEIVALASYPRFDPNDFTPQGDQSRLLRWLENEWYIGSIWNGKEKMKRELVKSQQFFEEQEQLTWQGYINRVLSPGSKVRKEMEGIKDIRGAYKAQEQQENLLVIDLCRLLVNKERFSEKLLDEVGEQSLSDYFALSQAYHTLQSLLYPKVKELFHSLSFAIWRANHFKEFLKEKRKEEKEKKTYARPYTEYLEKMERKLFREFWQDHKLEIVEGLLLEKKEGLEEYFSELKNFHCEQIDILRSYSHLSHDYLKSMRSFDELDRPLLGHYRALRHIKGVQLEKHLAAAFYPLSGFGYARSQAYRQSTPQGSVFKLVTAYQGLLEKKDHLNPLTVVDDMRSSQHLGYTLSGEPIYRNYKGGLLPRAHPNIGKVDLIGALERSSNIYFSILAGDCLEDPMNLANAARLFGFGKKTGIDLPGEIPGTIPNDLKQNRTGLYSFAIGQHSLTVTPLQTARMLSAVVNGGELLKPQIIQMVAGKEPSRELSSLTFPFKKDLTRVGIHFPLFTEVQKNQEVTSYLYSAQKEIQELLYLPQELRYFLMEGMNQVVNGPNGTARLSLIRNLPISSQAIKDYADLQHQLIGKTGTAEILYKGSCDPETSAEMKKHVWFAGASLNQGEPELVVVVYLRFGQAGKEAAPLAGQMVKKWREILSKRATHQNKQS